MRINKKYSGESFESMFKRFKKAIEKNNTLLEVKKREFYEKPSSIRKRSKEMAVSKEQKRQREQHLRRFM